MQLDKKILLEQIESLKKGYPENVTDLNSLIESRKLASWEKKKTPIWEKRTKSKWEKSTPEKWSKSKVPKWTKDKKVDHILEAKQPSELLGTGISKVDTTQRELAPAAAVQNRIVKSPNKLEMPSTQKEVKPEVQQEPVKSDGIEWIGTFSNKEKEFIKKLPKNKWESLYPRELLCSREDMLSGFKGNSEQLVQSIDENKKVVKVPYKYIDGFFKRENELTIKINGNSVNLIKITPKTKNPIPAVAIGNSLFFSIVENGKTSIYKDTPDNALSAFTENPNQSIKEVEQSLVNQKPTPTATTSAPKPKAPIASPSVKKEAKIAKKTNIEKSASNSYPRIQDPKSVMSNNIIIKSKYTGNKEIPIEIVGFDKANGKIKFKYDGKTFTTSSDYIKKSFVRETK